MFNIGLKTILKKSGDVHPPLFFGLLKTYDIVKINVTALISMQLH